MAGGNGFRTDVLILVNTDHTQETEGDDAER